MKNGLRPIALVLAAALLAVSPAHAADKEMVRASQMRLFDLGYYVGPYDGIAGMNTQAAIRSFQQENHLSASGKLSQKTYDALVAADYKQNHGGNSLSVSESAQAADPNTTWHFIETKNIPTRYGTITIDEEMMGELHRYSIKLNEHQFLRADNQPGALTVSKVFQLKNEDALVITAFRGKRDCVYKNYLVTLHGSSPMTREFESCSPSNEVHQAFDALFVRFAGTMNRGVYDSWDVWRYEHNRLQRM